MGPLRSPRFRCGFPDDGAFLAVRQKRPPLARAVSVGMVRIESGHGTNLAAVSKKGQLLVNAGLTTTRAGQVTVAAADLRSLVVAFGEATCAAGGIYKIPAGKGAYHHRR